MEESLKIIGLTGGIASGKSTVAARLGSHGVTIIDADQIAREIVMPGCPALDAIVKTFGTEMLQTNGSLDRARLGALVFSNPSALQKLNRITHPAMLMRLQQHLVAYTQQGLPWLVYEAALIIEQGLSPNLSELIVVLCSADKQRQRLMNRNNLNQEQAQQRISAQTTNEKRREVATLLIENNGDLEQLHQKSDELYDKLVRTYGHLESQAAP